MWLTCQRMWPWRYMVPWRHGAHSAICWATWLTCQRKGPWRWTRCERQWHHPWHGVRQWETAPGVWEVAYRMQVGTICPGPHLGTHAAFMVLRHVCMYVCMYGMSWYVMMVPVSQEATCDLSCCRQPTTTQLNCVSCHAYMYVLTNQLVNV